MKLNLIRIILALVFLSIPCALPFAAEGSRPIIAATEGPTLLNGGGINQPMTEAEYMNAAAGLSHLKHFVGINRMPTGLSANARFGFNLVVQGKNISWILDRADNTGYVLHADFNANGDLTDDKPTTFRKHNGKFVAEIKIRFVEIVDGRQRQYPYMVRLTLLDQTLTGKSDAQKVLEVQDGTARRGTVNVNGRRLMFELRGRNGHYDEEFSSLFFDLDGNGTISADERYSPEEYKVKERWVNIANRSFEFTVDRFGERLTLRPLPNRLPDRPDLRNGNVAPDFGFRDIEGRDRRLSEFQGKVVLIHIWMPWCAPSVTEAPRIVNNYNRLSEKGFEIISLNNGDTVDNLRKFAVTHGMVWPQGLANEAFLSLYRIDRYPSYFVIGRDGRIASNDLRPGDQLYGKVEELLRK